MLSEDVSISIMVAWISSLLEFKHTYVAGQPFYCRKCKDWLIIIFSDILSNGSARPQDLSTYPQPVSLGHDQSPCRQFWTLPPSLSSRIWAGKIRSRAGWVLLYQTPVPPYAPTLNTLQPPQPISSTLLYQKTFLSVLLLQIDYFEKSWLFRNNVWSVVKLWFGFSQLPLKVKH